MRNVVTISLLLMVSQLLAQSPDSLQASRIDRFKQIDSLIADYQFEKALTVLTTNLDTLDVGVLQRAGQCNFRLGRSAQSILYYDMILSIDSTNRLALNQLGQILGHEGEYLKARDCYWRLMEIDSTNSYYYKQAAFMSAKAEDKLMAAWEYDKALKLNPSDVEASLALGAILMEWEQFERVDSLVTVALEKDPQQRQLVLLKAKSSFGQKKYDDVIISINSLVGEEHQQGHGRGDTTAVYARLLGASYFQLHAYDKVLACMNYLLSHDYESDWIYYYCGVAYRELGDTPKSIGYFKRAVEKSISENTSTYYSQLAMSYEENKDYQNAIKAYRAAYDYSKEGIFLYHLARNYDVYYKDKTQALTYYKKYLASDDTIRLAKEYSKRRIQVIGR